MGRRAIDDAEGDDLTARGDQAFLRRRIDELAAQLDRLNERLSGGSRGGTQKQEQE
jgi:hypothetical protein